jgi:hypothetical protein
LGRAGAAFFRALVTPAGRRTGAAAALPAFPLQVRDGTEPAGALDAAVRDRFDVIGWDIRGADDGSRARCFSSVEAAERFLATRREVGPIWPMSSMRQRMATARRWQPQGGS